MSSESRDVVCCVENHRVSFNNIFEELKPAGIRLSNLPTLYVKTLNN